MLCDTCIGVLQYRRNGLTKRTKFLDLEPNGLNDGDDTEGLTLDKLNSIVERLGAEDDEEVDEELDEELDAELQEESEEESEADELYRITFGHHKSAMELGISAKWGCYICQTFWDKAELNVDQQRESDDRVETDQVFWPTFFTYAYLTQEENRDGIKLEIHALRLSIGSSTFFLRPNYGMYRLCTTGCPLISAQMSHDHHTMMKMEMARVLIKLVIVCLRSHYT
jgi:hypothetical protein